MQALYAIVFLCVLLFGLNFGTRPPKIQYKHPPPGLNRAPLRLAPLPRHVGTTDETSQPRHPPPPLDEYPPLPGYSRPPTKPKPPSLRPPPIAGSRIPANPIQRDSPPRSSNDISSIGTPPFVYPKFPPHLSPSFLETDTEPHPLGPIFEPHGDDPVTSSFGTPPKARLPPFPPSGLTPISGAREHPQNSPLRGTPPRSSLRRPGNLSRSNVRLLPLLDPDMLPHLPDFSAGASSRVSGRPGTPYPKALGGEQFKAPSTPSSQRSINADTQPLSPRGVSVPNIPAQPAKKSAPLRRSEPLLRMPTESSNICEQDGDIYNQDQPLYLN